MSFTVNTTVFKYKNFQTNALLFLPNGPVKPLRAIFTHGYTSSKHSILTWGSRLAESSIPAVIFDLPGHYLGSFNEVSNVEDFKRDAPGLFAYAYQELLNVKTDYQQEHQLIVGGHSLGALMSLKALERGELPEDTMAITVGFGLGPENETHAFHSDFYKKAFEFRQQLVCESLRGNFVLPWIKEQKESLHLKGKRIHFITGKDDVVVSKDGSERLVKLLQEKGNDVSLTRPNKMSHHMPELAGPHMMAFVRDLLKSKRFLESHKPS